jgi:hypothetical protein
MGGLPALIGLNLALARNGRRDFPGVVAKLDNHQAELWIELQAGIGHGHRALSGLR